MSMIIEVIENFFPEVRPVKVVGADVYENIVWMNPEGRKISKSQIEGKLQDARDLVRAKKEAEQRIMNYRMQADDLLAEWIFDREENRPGWEEKRQAWIDKVKEIKGL